MNKNIDFYSLFILISQCLGLKHNIKLPVYTLRVSWKIPLISIVFFLKKYLELRVNVELGTLLTYLKWSQRISKPRIAICESHKMFTSVGIVPTTAQ